MQTMKDNSKSTDSDTIEMTNSEKEEKESSMNSIKNNEDRTHIISDNTETISVAKNKASNLRNIRRLKPGISDSKPISNSTSDSNLSEDSQSNHINSSLANNLDAEDSVSSSTDKDVNSDIQDNELCNNHESPNTTDAETHNSSQDKEESPPTLQRQDVAADSTDDESRNMPELTKLLDNNSELESTGLNKVPSDQPPEACTETQKTPEFTEQTPNLLQSEQNSSQPPPEQISTMQQQPPLQLEIPSTQQYNTVQSTPQTYNQVPTQPEQHQQLQNAQFAPTEPYMQQMNPQDPNNHVYQNTIEQPKQEPGMYTQPHVTQPYPPPQGESPSQIHYPYQSAYQANPQPFLPNSPKAAVLPQPPHQTFPQSPSPIRSPVAASPLTSPVPPVHHNLPRGISPVSPHSPNPPLPSSSPLHPMGPLGYSNSPSPARSPAMMPPARSPRPSAMSPQPQQSPMSPPQGYAPAMSPHLNAQSPGQSPHHYNQNHYQNYNQPPYQQQGGYYPYAENQAPPPPYNPYQPQYQHSQYNPPQQQPGPYPPHNGYNGYPPQLQMQYPQQQPMPPTSEPILPAPGYQGNQLMKNETSSNEIPIKNESLLSDDSNSQMSSSDTKPPDSSTTPLPPDFSESNSNSTQADNSLLSKMQEMTKQTNSTYGEALLSSISNVYPDSEHESTKMGADSTYSEDSRGAFSPGISSADTSFRNEGQSQEAEARKAEKARVEEARKKQLEEDNEVMKKYKLEISKEIKARKKKDKKNFAPVPRKQKKYIDALTQYDPESEKKYENLFSSYVKVHDCLFDRKLGRDIVEKFCYYKPPYEKLPANSRLKTSNSPEQEYDCKACDMKYKKRHLFCWHLNTVHHEEGDRPVTCPLCSETFKRPWNMREHLRFRHMQGKVPCLKCQRTFVSAHMLRKHMKLHTQYNKFKRGKKGKGNEEGSDEEEEEGEGMEEQMEADYEDILGVGEKETKVVLGQVENDTFEAIADFRSLCRIALGPEGASFKPGRRPGAQMPGRPRKEKVDVLPGPPAPAKVKKARLDKLDRERRLRRIARMRKADRPAAYAELGIECPPELKNYNEDSNQQMHSGMQGGPQQIHPGMQGGPQQMHPGMQGGPQQMHPGMQGGPQQIHPAMQGGPQQMHPAMQVGPCEGNVPAPERCGSAGVTPVPIMTVTNEMYYQFPGEPNSVMNAEMHIRKVPNRTNVNSPAPKARGRGSRGGKGSRARKANNVSQSSPARGPTNAFVGNAQYGAPPQFHNNMWQAPGNMGPQHVKHEPHMVPPPDPNNPHAYQNPHMENQPPYPVKHEPGMHNPHDPNMMHPPGNNYNYPPAPPPPEGSMDYNSQWNPNGYNHPPPMQPTYQQPPGYPPYAGQQYYPPPEQPNYTPPGHIAPPPGHIAPPPPAGNFPPSDSNPYLMQAPQPTPTNDHDRRELDPSEF